MLENRGWGKIETLLMKDGGWTAVISLIITYALQMVVDHLPEIAGTIDWGNYGPAVLIAVGAIVQWAKLYLSSNAPKVEAAVKADKAAAKVEEKIEAIDERAERAKAQVKEK